MTPMPTLRTLAFCLTAFLLVPTTPALAGNLYVDDDDATCGGNVPCFSDIQAAVAAALDGDVLLIAGGTYTGIHTFEASGDLYYQVVSILDKSLELRGGFEGGSDWLTSDPSTYPTLIDAAGAGRGISILGTGSETVTLDGLQLRNGNGDGKGSDVDASVWECGYSDADCGGAVYARSVDLEIRRSRIEVNRASDSRRGLGGGVFASSVGRLELVDTVLSQNFADVSTSYGGALYTRYCGTIRIVGSTFSSNTGLLGGSAFYDQQASERVEIVGSTFHANSASSVVGAAWPGTPWKIAGSQFLDNGATYQLHWYKVGGEPGTIELENLLSRHTATSVHFAIYDDFGSGGEVLLEAKHLTLVNGDAGFHSRSTGGAPVSVDASNVLFSDVDWAFSAEDSIGNVGFTHRNSLVDGELETHHVSTGTPIFVEIDPVAGSAGLNQQGFLAPGSGAIDAGMDAGVFQDLEGDPRPDGAGPDVGCDEMVVSALFWSRFESGDLGEWEVPAPLM